MCSPGFFSALRNLKSLPSLTQTTACRLYKKMKCLVFFTEIFPQVIPCLQALPENITEGSCATPKTVPFAKDLPFYARERERERSCLRQGTWAVKQTRPDLWQLTVSRHSGTRRNNGALPSSIDLLQLYHLQEIISRECYSNCMLLSASQALSAPLEPWMVGASAGATNGKQVVLNYNLYASR